MEIFIDLMKDDLDEEYFNSIFEEYNEDYGMNGIIKLKFFLDKFILNKIKKGE